MFLPCPRAAAPSLASPLGHRGGGTVDANNVPAGWSVCSQPEGMVLRDKGRLPAPGAKGPSLTVPDVSCEGQSSPGCPEDGPGDAGDTGSGWVPTDPPHLPESENSVLWAVRATAGLSPGPGCDVTLVPSLGYQH